jgi:hypothetical protein
LIKGIDIFDILDNVTTTEGVSLVQVNTWLFYILGIFVTVIIALFVYMNSRFTEAQSDRNLIKQTQSQHSVDLAELKTLMKLQLLKDGFSFQDIDNAVARVQQNLETETSKPSE